MFEHYDWSVVFTNKTLGLQQQERTGPTTLPTAITALTALQAPGTVGLNMQTSTKLNALGKFHMAVSGRKNRNLIIIIRMFL